MSEIMRTEYSFMSALFMADVRKKANGVSLRPIAFKVGVSASTLSRIDNGEMPDMETFMQICARLELSPGNYFARQVWKLESEDNE